MMNFLKNNIAKLHHVLMQKKEMKFLLVGGYNTLFSLILTNILLFFISDQYVILVLLLSYAIGLVHNYFSFEKLVFHSKIGFVKGVIRLNNTYCITESIKIGIIYVLVHQFGVNDNVAYNVVFPLTLTMKYVMHRKYTFNASFK